MSNLSNSLSRRGFVTASATVLASALTARFVRSASAETEPTTTTAPTSRPAMFAGELKTVKLEDDLVVIFGAGGNVAAHFDADRLLVIDCGIRPRAAELHGLVSALAPQAKEKTLVNTHWHADHTGGNIIFTDSGFRIISSGKCRQRLGETITNEDMQMTTTPLPAAARPTITFEQGLKLYEPTGVRLAKIAPAHTDTDAVVFFEKHNVLHTGDLLFSNMFPVIDRATGGSLDGMIKSTNQLLKMLNPKSRVIPGHGEMGDATTVAAQLDLLKTIHDKLAPLGEKKTSMKEVMDLKPLADLDEKWGKGFFQSSLVTPMYYGQWLTR